MYFDIVITDMQMPEMDGNEVALHIRNSERPCTPVIGISGEPYFFNKNNFDLLLSKPFSLKELTGSVMSLVN
ncbi:MAG: response regulator [Desulfobacteraceae bacterium]|nr:response regulator [Desulfobacteraceae bacterium]